jgi:hypothetical protein
MSAIPSNADIAESDQVVRFVPKADTWHCSKFGQDSAHCGRKQAAWKRGHDPTNITRDEREQFETDAKAISVRTVYQLPVGISVDHNPSLAALCC